MLAWTEIAERAAARSRHGKHSVARPRATNNIRRSYSAAPGSWETNALPVKADYAHVHLQWASIAFVPMARAPLSATWRRNVVTFDM